MPDQSVDVVHLEQQVDEEDGMKLEPFNLTRERAEGHFDESGHYVEHKPDEDAHDAWLDSGGRLSLGLMSCSASTTAVSTNCTVPGATDALLLCIVAATVVSDEERQQIAAREAAAAAADAAPPMSNTEVARHQATIAALLEARLDTFDVCTLAMCDTWPCIRPRIEEHPLAVPWGSGS